MEPDEAMAELRSIKGIGPFYSALHVIRASGLADVLPENEPMVLEAAARHDGLPHPPTPEQFRAMAEAWKPFRTWAAVLMRAAENSDARAGRGDGVGRRSRIMRIMERLQQELRRWPSW